MCVTYAFPIFSYCAIPNSANSANQDQVGWTYNLVSGGVRLFKLFHAILFNLVCCSISENFIMKAVLIRRPMQRVSGAWSVMYYFKIFAFQPTDQSLLYLKQYPKNVYEVHKSFHCHIMACFHWTVRVSTVWYGTVRDRTPLSSLRFHREYPYLICVVYAGKFKINIKLNITLCSAKMLRPGTNNKLLISLMPVKYIPKELYMLGLHDIGFLPISDMQIIFN